MMTNEQLELGFNGIKPRANATRHEGRIARASWWFDRMRAAVGGAMDWQSPGQPQPEQIWMPGANREVNV